MGVTRTIKTGALNLVTSHTISYPQISNLAEAIIHFCPKVSQEATGRGVITESLEPVCVE